MTGKKKPPVLDAGLLKENVGRRFGHPHDGHRSLGSISECNAVSHLEHNSCWGQVQRHFEPFKLGHLGTGTVQASP